MPEDPTRAQKRRRISRACDYCHQRSKRCRPSGSGTRCQNCIAFDQRCTFDRPQKKRGAPFRSQGAAAATSKPNRHDPGSPRAATSGAAAPVRSLAPPGTPSLLPCAPNTSPEKSDVHNGPWQCHCPVSHSTIMDLVELFFEVVYPIFPLFHQPTFLHQISRAKYTSDRSLFTVTMAACALVSARVRDGAVFNPRWDPVSLQHPLPEVYYREAVRELHQQSSKTDINILRSHVILALAAIQDGNVRDMQMNIGHYHTIVATEGLHDEDNWPQGLGLVEIEERRRLFWSVYTFDIFTSIVWGGVIRSREYQSNVSYPTEVDDDMFDDSGFLGTETPSNAIDNSLESTQQGSKNISWIAGRNFVVDLYRVLEHIMMRLASRKGRAQRRTLADEVLRASDSLSQESVLNSVMEMYARLPQCLKVTNPVTSRARLDRFGFQAADIIASIQLLRMVLLSAVGAGISEKCQVANEVVSAFIAIPATYHHAISVPLLFHLSIIVQIMATTMEQPLTEGDYNKIRDIMMSMVRLLSTLECLHASKDASQRLKDQIARIDNYMAFQHHDVPNQTGTTFSTESGSSSTGKPFSDAMPANLSQTALNDTLVQLPLQLPSDLLGDLSQIFDFSHMP